MVVKEKGEKVAEAKLFETSQLGIFGNVQISTQVIHELCQRGIPVRYHHGGWFCGMTVGFSTRTWISAVRSSAPPSTDSLASPGGSSQ